MNNNTQLPAELDAEINEKSELSADFLSNDETVSNDYLNGYKRGRTEGAIEYATKLHRATEYLNLLLSAQISDLKAPDHLINEIKTFLDGK